MIIKIHKEYHKRHAQHYAYQLFYKIIRRIMVAARANLSGIVAGTEYHDQTKAQQYRHKHNKRIVERLFVFNFPCFPSALILPLPFVSVFFEGQYILPHSVISLRSPVA